MLFNRALALFLALLSPSIPYMHLSVMGQESGVVESEQEELEEELPDPPLPDGTAEVPLFQEIDGADILDFSTLTLSTLPSLVTGGSLDFRRLAEQAGFNPDQLIEELGYDPSRVWDAGASLGSILQLGDLTSSTSVQEWTAGFLAEQAELDMRYLTLETFELFQEQNLETLAEIIPALQDLPVNQIAPLIELLRGRNIDLSQTLPEILAAQPELGFLSFDPDVISAIGLDYSSFQSFSILDIPGLIDLPLGEIPDFQTAILNQIPGLSSLPLTAIFGGGFLPNGIIAIADMPYSDAEGRIPERLSMSGSFREGFSVPCEGGCSYAEFAAIAELRDNIVHPTNWIQGKRWGNGEQKVMGGEGCLAGEEPTGRHPYGSVFKMVLEEANEQEGTFTFALYFRFPVFCGMTPYIIGPMPFMTVAEGDPFYIGTEAAPVDSGGTISLPPGVTLPPGTIPSGTTPTTPRELPPIDPNMPPGLVTGTLTHPLPGSVMTSPWGWRRGRMHSGTDFAYPRADSRWPGTIVAADGGVVEVIWDSSQSRGCGITVVIRHGPNRRTGYCHIVVGGVHVTPGQQVSKGQAIATVGATGTSYGTYPEHLHFIVWENGTKVNPMTVIGR